MNNQQTVNNQQPARDYIPPVMDAAATEAEQYFLSQLFSAAEDKPAEAIIHRYGQDTGKYFVHDADRNIYSAMLELASKGKNIDAVNITEALLNEKKLEAAGGSAYITSLQNLRESSVSRDSRINNADEKLEIMRNYWAKRDMRNTIMAAYGLACQDDSHSFENLSTFVREGADRYDAAHTPVVKKENAFKQWRENAKRQEIGEDDIPRISTGLSELDGYLKGGFMPKKLYIIGGRPGMGKSVLAGNIAVAAAKEGMRVIYFSLEMSTEELINCFLASETGILKDKVENITLCSEDEKETLYKASEEFERWHIDIVDTLAHTVSDITSYIRREKSVNGADLVIIDHLQLIKAEKAENQTAEISQIADGLLAIAKNIDIPVVALSQLNRDVTNTQTKVPNLASLRGSGNLEQNANVVIFLHRVGYYDKDKNPEHLLLLIEKNRSGMTGEINMRLQFKISKVTEEQVSESRSYYDEYVNTQLETNNRKRKKKVDDDPLLEIPW